MAVEGTCRWAETSLNIYTKTEIPDKSYADRESYSSITTLASQIIGHPGKAIANTLPK
ncbi:MAG: hypothetical protein RIE73_23675 [Coleofasciculus sp. C1-SOL-03]|uniref:hypothetical protein n=1 Tax=Coleofasciculus sp. C1-SOL-03 TaxID=3069522 RepID=UPI0032F2DA3F